MVRFNYFMQKYVVLNKVVGQTPLECAEVWRAAQPPALQGVPLAYAGRLDPMASGKLLVLIGDECKRQEQYHKLDKAYTFESLFGIATDTADVLGRIKKVEPTNVSKQALKATIKKLIGDIELPYPHFSSKTVQGKPLHTWAVEERLHEIIIPTKDSTIYKLKLLRTEQMSGQAVYDAALEKINSIPLVTDPRKSIGNDFRRIDVRIDWKTFLDKHRSDTFTVASISCIASSGTYMRTLAEVIARKCNTVGLAFSIERTIIGRYTKIPLLCGMWTTRF